MHGFREIVGDDDVGMVGIIAGDMGEGIVRAVHNFHGQDERVELHAPVRILSCLRGGSHERQGAGAAAEFHARSAEFFRHHGKELFGYILMHKDAFEGVAHAGTLNLAVIDDIESHGEISGAVHIAVADALEMLEHGHGGRFGHGAHEPLAPAGNHDIDILIEFAQGCDCGVIRSLHKLGGVLGKAGLPERLLQEGREETVGVQGLAAAAQDNSVAGFEAENGRVNGHVGTGLINHGDDTERHAHLANEHAVGTLPLFVQGAYGIRHIRYLDAGSVHVFHDGRGQGEPVQTGGVQAEPDGFLHVFFVDFNNLLPAVHEQTGQGIQKFGLGGRRGGRHGTRRLAGLSAHFADSFHRHKKALLDKVSFLKINEKGGLCKWQRAGETPAPAIDGNGNMPEKTRSMEPPAQKAAGAESEESYGIFLSRTGF